MPRKSQKKKKTVRKASSDRVADKVARMFNDAKIQKKKVKHLSESIWRKLHQKQTGQVCQIITALNAACVLTKGKQVVELNSNHFQHCIDIAGARFGSAISPKEVHKYLGIEVLKQHGSIFSCWEFPFELNVWYKDYGFHSVCVVDYEWRTDSYRIANFSRATSLRGWILYEDLQHYIKSPGQNWVCRSFKLTPK